MYNYDKASNSTQITYEYAMQFQTGDIPDEHCCPFINMSDIGRYQCWDEAGLANGITDTLNQAKVKTAMYAWDWLEGADMRLEYVPLFIGNEQSVYARDYYYNKPMHIGMVVRYRATPRSTIVHLIRVDTGWKPANNDDLANYIQKFGAENNHGKA